MMNNSINQVELWGSAEALPTFSHENHGASFFQFPLLVPRLSGLMDRLQILIPETLREGVFPGARLRLRGQLRSFNNKSGSGNRLVLTVFAQELSPGDEEVRNRILLCGTVCKPPTLRRTPLGRNICDLMLAVKRRYGRSDYLPAIAWGQLALLCGALETGDSLCLEGRVQSRSYNKLTEAGSEERTAYEVSIMQLTEPEETGAD